MSEERKRTIRAYGAEIICTKTAATITETFEIARRTALELVASDPKYFLAKQFDNPANCEAHYIGTGAEITEQMGELPLDAFVAAIGTGGTITGCAKRLRESYPDIKIVAVEPSESAVLSKGNMTMHGQQGIGDGFIPAILDTGCYDYISVVEDGDAFGTARKLAFLEGIFCGISSGSNVWAAIEFAKTLPEGSNVVTICPDSGERYLSVENFVKL